MQLAPARPPDCSVGRVLVSERIEAHDGVALSADVHLPDLSAPVPALLAAGPHGKALDALGVSSATSFVECGPVDFYVERGYAVVRLDVRGTGESEGEWMVLGPEEQRDLETAIAWIAAQPWCSGAVGMMGMSYYAMSQWFAAARAPPALKCIVPFSGGSDVYRDFAYPGGVFGEGFVGSWFTSTRLRSMLDNPNPRRRRCGGAFLDQVLRHPTADCDFWRDRSALVEGCEVPTFAVAFWANPPHLHGTLAAFERLRGPKRLLVLGARLPDPPEEVRRLGPVPPFHAAQQDPRLQGELLRWYDHWLKGVDTGVLQEPPVQLQCVGAPSVVMAPATWPPPDSRVLPVYLSSGTRSAAVESLNCGSLVPSPPTDASHAQMLVPDPHWSFPGPGVAVLEGGPPNGVKRIFTFTSEPLQADLDLSGPIKASLFAAYSQGMTSPDVIVKLQDQPPETLVARALRRVTKASPFATKVSVGWLKVTHRPNSLRPVSGQTDAQELLQPVSGIMRLEVEMMPATYRLKKGHRLRVEIAPADSMILDGPLWHRFSVQQGSFTLFSTPEHPSHLLLPVASPPTTSTVIPAPSMLSTGVLVLGGLLAALAVSQTRFFRP